MRLSVAVSTANIAAVADGDWALIAPYGDHASPDGSYTQRFSRDQAEKVVSSWNSVSGTAARIFKNLLHGRVGKASLPVWDGHPETDKQRWPVDRLLAEITAIRTSNDGLEGRVTWNTKGLQRRTQGPLYPSPLWWHWPPAGEPPSVFPELLESIGLVPTPNIASVPAWTQNARQDANPLAHNPAEPQKPMNEEQLKALRAALGLPETADPAACITAAQTANSAARQLTERETALTTANSAKATLESDLADANTRLTTANGQLSTLTQERDTLTTANTALLEGIISLAEAKGAITPAERDTFKAKVTANAAATVTELASRKAMNTAHIEINGNRIDLSTANARQGALESAISKRMADEKCDRDTAFARVQSDPAFATLFASMADPTKQAK